MSDSNNVFAQHLPEELRDQDPSKFFPDFEQGAILRFTRIFAGTFRGGGGNDPEIFNSQLWGPSRTYRPKIERGIEEERQGKPEHSLELNIGPAPSSKNECCMDENDLLCAANLDHLLPNNIDAMKPRRHFRRVYRYRTPFRLGKIWDTPLEEGELREEGHQTLSDDTFLPVNFVPWEDDVIIDPEKAKTKLIEELSKCAKDQKKLPKCGWIPTEKTPTFKEFMTAWRNGSFLKYLDNPTNIRRKPKVPIIPVQSKKRRSAKQNSEEEQIPNNKLPSMVPQFSIFPAQIDGPEWEDGSADGPWEERVIWGN